MEYVMHTNSDHLTIDLLTHTDVCSIGINLMIPSYEQYAIKTLRINNCEPFLVIGYIYPEGSTLSPAARWFIDKFETML